jgi:hypothetical protein
MYLSGSVTFKSHTGEWEDHICFKGYGKLANLMWFALKCYKCNLLRNIDLEKIVTMQRRTCNVVNPTLRLQVTMPMLGILKELNSIDLPLMSKVFSEFPLLQSKGKFLKLIFCHLP